jgi:hypothetical protein
VSISYKEEKNSAAGNKNGEGGTKLLLERNVFEKGLSEEEAVVYFTVDV